MNAIKVVQHLQTTDTLLAIKREQMHGFVIHTHQKRNECSLFGTKIMAMQGRTTTEAGIKHIKTISHQIILQIRIKAQETGETHEKNQMEIGHTTPLACIQPADGVREIGKQGTIHPLFAQSMGKKFTLEKGNR